MIRTVFLGSPQFAVPSLQALANDSGIEVSLVVTQPDRPSGRGRKLQPPAIKAAAEALGISVFQPESLRGEAAFERLSTEKPDVLVVVSYGEILRHSVLELPPHGCLNVHPSLLPSYRGSTPIPAAILNGDTETGVTIMRLVRQMDAGPIVSQHRISLAGTETTGSLTDVLSHTAARFLPSIVRGWVAGEIQEKPQDDAMVTYTRELRKSDAQIDWSQPADYVERFVRAMDPWPRAWTMIQDQRLTVHAVRTGPQESPESKPGTISVRGDSISVSTGQGTVELTSVQPAGKKPMPAADWVRGARLADQLMFQSPLESPAPLIYKR